MSRRPAPFTAVRPFARAALLAFVTSISAGCGDGGVTGPDGLSPFQRSAIEEVAVDRVTDLLWIAEEAHGGTFPQLPYAFGLPGVEGGALGSITVDPSLDPGLFEPFCEASGVEGIRRCLRIRLYDDGDYDLRSYYTVPPDQTARARDALSYEGEGSVATVRYAPQPLRVWTFDVTTEGEANGGSAEVDERFTLTTEEGAALEIALTGTVTADLGDPREVDAELSMQVLPGCDDLTVSFHAVRAGDAGGEITCAGHAWATLVLSPDQLPHVVWQD